MKTELGLRAGIVLPLLTTLIIGMSILVGFNYISQLNIIKEQEIRAIEAAINTTNILLETTPLYQNILNITLNNTNILESYLNIEKNSSKLKKSINSDIGFIAKKNYYLENFIKKQQKILSVSGFLFFFTGNEPKIFISEQSINKVSQIKKEDKDYFIIYIPIKEQSGKILF